MARPTDKLNLPVDRHLYGLFIKNGEGPLCKGFFVSLEVAKAEALRLAEVDGYEYLIFDLLLYVQVARISPPQSSAQ
jgi:hypothetical protein